MSSTRIEDQDVSTTLNNVNELLSDLGQIRQKNLGSISGLKLGIIDFHSLKIIKYVLEHYLRVSDEPEDEDNVVSDEVLDKLILAEKNKQLSLPTFTKADGHNSISKKENSYEAN
jgi:hypothetical protein